MPNRREAYKNRYDESKRAARDNFTTSRASREKQRTKIPRLCHIASAEEREERFRRKDGDKSRMSTVTRGVEQHKARIIHTVDKSRQKQKKERKIETETNVNNEQSDSRC